MAFQFDFTGRGDADGDFADKTVSGNVGDLVRAATTLIQEDLGPCIMIGHCSVAAVLLAAERIKTVTEVITIGAPADVGHVTHLFADDLDRLRAEGRTEVCIGGRTFELDHAFVEDLASTTCSRRGPRPAVSHGARSTMTSSPKRRDVACRRRRAETAARPRDRRPHVRPDGRVRCRARRCPRVPRPPPELRSGRGFVRLIENWSGARRSARAGSRPRRPAPSRRRTSSRGSRTRRPDRSRDRRRSGPG